MTTKQFVISTLSGLKHASYSERLVLPVRNSSSETIANLELIVADQSRNMDIISLCAKWRKQYEWWFPKQFNVTIEGTQRWLEKGVIDAEDRILFLIVSNGIPIGHIGLYRFDYGAHSCELDNVLRGANGPLGVMTYVTKALMDWAKVEFRLRQMTLRVFEDNHKAIALYERVGFHRVSRIPLRKEIRDGDIIWEEDEKNTGAYERAYLVMQYSFGSV